MKIRYPAVEGMFYPAESSELDRMLDSFDSKASADTENKPKAVIVPHAGLIYSGLTAAFAYKTAGLYKYRTAVIFAPSHKVAFYGMSGADFDEYRFCGRSIKVNTELTGCLNRSNGMSFIEQVHLSEHSTEVQLPFIYRYMKESDISVFVYGETDPAKVSYVISEIIKEGKDLVIISSDLSHYHNYDKCKMIDNDVLEGIKELDTARIGKGEACGMTGIKAVVQSAKTIGLKSKVLDYRNSGDIISDRSGVVGYMSAIFY